jgi:hypothetical protein
VRTLALLLLVPTAVYADEIDLSQRGRGDGQPATWVIRAEGGNEFAPYGYAGVAVSWLTESGFEFEGGAGGGFPGLQLGFAARRVFMFEGGPGLATEIALAGNTRVNRAAAETGTPNTAAVNSTSSLWTLLGLGFELRQERLDLSVVASIVFTTASLSPKWAIHGGVGFGF